MTVNCISMSTATLVPKAKIQKKPICSSTNGFFKKKKPVVCIHNAVLFFLCIWDLACMLVCEPHVSRPQKAENMLELKLQKAVRCRVGVRN